MSVVGRIGSPSHSRSSAALFRMNRISELGTRQAIQQAGAAESGERQLVLDAQLAAWLDEARLHRGNNVLASLRFT